MSGQYKQGQTGNAGGRPKAQSDAARTMAHMIIEQTHGGRELVLFALAILRCDPTKRTGRPTGEQSAIRLTLADHGLTADDVTLQDRKWALEWLSDRGAGKALQTLDLSADLVAPPAVPLEGAPEDIEAAERVLRATRAKLVGNGG